MTAKKSNAVLKVNAEVDHRHEDSTPGSFITLALEKNAPIEQLEKLMALQERYEQGKAKKAFLAAMAEFQRTVPEILKTKKVAYNDVNYKFASLGLIVKSIKNCEAENGLSHRWEISEEGKNLNVTCIISHVDGHSERTNFSSEADDSGKKNKIQSRASAISYLQRYTLIGALGLSTADEDNDGLTAEKKEKPQQQQRESLPADIQKLITDAKDTDVLKEVWENHGYFQKKQYFKDAVNKRKKELESPATHANAEALNDGLDPNALPQQVSFEITLAENDQQLVAIYKAYPDLHTNPRLTLAITAKKQELTKKSGGKATGKQGEMFGDKKKPNF